LFLNDSSAGVVGAAAAAFIVVCPDHLSLLGPMFRKLCEMLLDVEEWGQVVLMDILMRYAVARYGAPRDSVFLSSSSSHTQIAALYSSIAVEPEQCCGYGYSCCTLGVCIKN
jgi:vesicle coat complex subunit